MRRVHFYLLLAALVAPLGAPADIDINFRGRVLQSSCEIESGTRNLEVWMGQLKKIRFSGVGSEVAKKYFTIRLFNCESVEGVEVYMTGEPDADNADYFAITDAPDRAQGVALGITMQDGRRHKPQGNTVPVPVNHLREKYLHYVASYVQTRSPVTTGSANSVVDYTIVYK